VYCGGRKNIDLEQGEERRWFLDRYEDPCESTDYATKYGFPVMNWIYNNSKNFKLLVNLIAVFGFATVSKTP
jgi:hypothetical protein